jgi:hypothetical protein
VEQVTEDADGMLTPYGFEVATRYASRWLAESLRDLTLERAHPELTGLFYDIRSDVELAHRYGDDVVKSGDWVATLRKALMERTIKIPKFTIPA